jgi:probable phosphoglycerate mutase
VSLLLLRHGQIVQQSPSRFVGQRDLPLTEHGRAQALAWADLLAAAPLASACCSDLSRCRDTAALALSGTALQATPLPGLREIHLGAWEGLTVQEVRERFPASMSGAGLTWPMSRPRAGKALRRRKNASGTP